MLRKPFKYQVRPVGGPGSPGELFVEGERFNIQRLYQNQWADPTFNWNRYYVPSMPFDPFRPAQRDDGDTGKSIRRGHVVSTGSALGPGRAGCGSFRFRWHLR